MFPSIDDIIGKIGAAIKGFALSIVTFGWVPEQWLWLLYLILFTVVCSFIIRFFGWSIIVRKVTSLAWLGAALFTVGGWVMQRRLKARETPDDPPT